MKPVAAHPRKSHNPATKGKLFLLSPYFRDSLSQQIAGFGWTTVAARRGARLVERFHSAGARIAVIDLRRSPASGLLAIATLRAATQAPIVAIGGGTEDHTQIADAYAAGASGFIGRPENPEELRFGLEFAVRSELDPWQPDAEQPALNWRLCKDDRLMLLASEALELRHPAVNQSHYPASWLYRSLNFAERSKARAAVRRLKAGRKQTGFLQVAQRQGIIHYLERDHGELSGWMEIQQTEDIQRSTGRDRLSGLHDANEMRTWLLEAKKEERAVELIMLGIKNFGSINLGMGRRAGDALLRETGRRLTSIAGDWHEPNAFLARVDGQNFLLARMVDSGSESISPEPIVDALSQPIENDGKVLNISARGAWIISEAKERIDSALQRAANALAEAMASDVIRIKYDGQESVDIQLEDRLETELAGAIARHEITIVFQPQFRVDTGQLSGAEALARWNHPELGVLGAGILFSVAKRAALEDRLSSHVQETALRLAQQWPNSLSFLRLSINITPTNLSDRRFVIKFLRMLTQSRFDPARLTVEITEAGLVVGLDHAASVLSRLREQGIKVAIDDFGTGYSSISYLRHLPVDYLKIDSKLTGDISGNATDQIVVRSVINLAHALDLPVIAEGVESAEQLAALAESECEFFQGYLRSDALTPENFIDFALRAN